MIHSGNAAGESDIPPLNFCEICGGELTLHARSHPGYREPATFDSFSCVGCGAVRASAPVDESLYDQIYSVRAHIPTYDRYERWATEITRHRDQLGYLASRSEIFWSVAERLRTVPAKTVLEVGCGLGYLTYALRKRGIDARGVDLSFVAVSEARERFGDFYEIATLADLRSRAERYDLVLMTELIEHVERPIELVREALGLIAPGGAVFITTPNRDFYPPAAIWQTEPAPVHVWWFSERSVEKIAERAGGTALLTDFSEFDRRFPDLYSSRLDITAPRGPILSVNGEVVRAHGIDFNGPPILQSMLEQLRKRNILQDVYRGASRLAGLLPRRRISSRRETIAAAISPCR